MTDQQVNGTQPGPDTAPDAAGVPMSERLMGLFGIAFALGIALIGFDLMTGGRVFSLIGAGMAAPEQGE